MQSGEALRTQASFGYEWTHFHDWRPSGTTNFNDYFQGLDLSALTSAVVLDAGCGMGRHTLHVASKVAGVVAVDFSRAIDVAARNVQDHSNVLCIQADLTSLPLGHNTFDFVYSMGVLHHLSDTEAVLRRLVETLKPGGRLRIYLYWKREGVVGAILAVVTLTRRVTTRLPFRLLRGICWILSVLITAVVLLPYRLFSRLGFEVKTSWPLAVYLKYPFNVVYNDQFDRFSAPLEKRYTRDQVIKLLQSVGLHDVKVRPQFGWIGDGVKKT